MSKIKKDKINFMDDDYVVEFGSKKNKQKTLVQTFDEEFSKAENETHMTEEELLKVNAKKALEDAENQAQKILDDANTTAQKTIANATKQATEIIEKAKTEATKNAKTEAEQIIAKAKETSQQEIDLSKESIEKERVETINNAYKEGYEDGHKKLLEELDEKIKFFDEFCKSQYSIEQNILKATSKEILDIILTISKKILFKEVDGKVIDEIIKHSITLLEHKENINIILSEKYAKFLYEFQKESLNSEINFDFKDFKQYKNFNISYSPEYADDTIIVENIKERLDASIASQIEILIRNIEEKTQQNKLEIEEYKRIHEIE